MDNKVINVKDDIVEIREDWLKNYRTYLENKARWELAEKELKAILLEAYENGAKLPDNEYISVVYKKAGTRSALDTKRIKEEQPEMYEEYLKVSPVSASISITGKGF